MSTQHTFLASILLLCAANVAGCNPSGSEPASDVAAILEDARNFPAAGDDLTMYIGDRFAEAEQRLAQLAADPAPPAPSF
jgi:hypothetical protein